ncbi:MAG: tRNA guanosine(34) transglycosylase Tgt [Bacteriovoracaceae bacterium]
MKKCEFKLEAKCAEARAGEFETAHGTVKTPIFMPVGTKGSVKLMKPESLEDVGAQIILGNTYHLYLRPGPEFIRKNYSTLHKFMRWDKPILTDSGGYQVFSLSGINNITEKGVQFRSHLDGSKHMITPEKSMEIQRDLGSDIVMAFDECPSLPASTDQIKKAVDRTYRWAKRCKEVELRDHQFLFGINQGGTELKLRLESLEGLKELGFSAHAIGGLSVGEKTDEMRELLENFVPHIPSETPRYLMGIGKPLDILHAIKSGVDMFDCVLPTRNARNGQALTSYGPLNIKNARFSNDLEPLDPHCDCYACKNFDRATIHHLYKSKEPLASMLITEHNLRFYLNLTKTARSKIISGEFDEFYQQFYKSYSEERYR